MKTSLRTILAMLCIAAAASRVSASVEDGSTVRHDVGACDDPSYGCLYAGERAIYYVFAASDYLAICAGGAGYYEGFAPEPLTNEGYGNGYLDACAILTPDGVFLAGGGGTYGTDYDSYLYNDGNGFLALTEDGADGGQFQTLLGGTPAETTVWVVGHSDNDPSTPDDCFAIGVFPVEGDPFVIDPNGCLV